jgi:hypothetical protein
MNNIHKGLGCPQTCGKLAGSVGVATALLLADIGISPAAATFAGLFKK